MALHLEQFSLNYSSSSFAIHHPRSFFRASLVPVYPQTLYSRQ